MKLEGVLHVESGQVQFQWHSQKVSKKFESLFAILKERNLNAYIYFCPSDIENEIGVPVSGQVQFQ